MELGSLMVQVSILDTALVRNLTSSQFELSAVDLDEQCPIHIICDTFHCIPCYFPCYFINHVRIQSTEDMLLLAKNGSTVVS